MLRFHELFQVPFDSIHRPVEAIALVLSVNLFRSRTLSYDISLTHPLSEDYNECSDGLKCDICENHRSNGVVCSISLFVGRGLQE